MVELLRTTIWNVPGASAATTTSVLSVETPGGGPGRDAGAAAPHRRRSWRRSAVGTGAAVRSPRSLVGVDVPAEKRVAHLAERRRLAGTAVPQSGAGPLGVSRHLRIQNSISPMAVRLSRRLPAKPA